MKIVGKILVLLALCMAGSASAQTTGDTACVPYKMPIDSTITSCGPGLIGSKFKTATKECPSGAVTESPDFDTSGCQVAPTETGGTLTQAARCRLMPDSCANSPTAAACPVGQKWSLLGSGVAHCVNDDPICPWGTSLTHDKFGNPSCVQNTCPSNQVLQADGKSCACSSGLVWNGSSCVVPTPTCVAGTTTTSSASCPYGGTKYYRETTSCPAGPYGAPSKTGYWDTSGCSSPPVTCTSSSYTESASCSGGLVGTQYRTVTTSCPSGSYGSPSTSYGSWNTSGCSGGCSPSQSTSSTSCGSGYTGTKYITTYYSCPSGSSQSTDTSGCGCANGANNYPTCSTPPPPTVCPASYKWCQLDWNNTGNGIDRETWYNYGETGYLGSSCTETVLWQSSRTEYDGGCPPGF